MMCEFFLVLKFFLVLRLNDLTATVVTIREGNGNPLQYSAWEIPWTEEPGRLQSMGSLRVGHY